MMVVQFFSRVSVVDFILPNYRSVAVADAQAFWDRMIILRVVTAGNAIGAQKFERRGSQQTIAEGIVAAIGWSCLQYKQL